MDALTLVGRISPGASARELSSDSGPNRNRVFRLVEESGRATVVKVYATPGRERRERHALEAVAGVTGVPKILDRGLTPEGVAWARLTDGGGWSIRSLTQNHEILERAGRVLAGVHRSAGSITNLAGGGMDGDYVAAHYSSTIERLGRYRRKLQIPAEVLEAAALAPPPACSDPVTAHARPTPEKFLVNDQSEVMLVDWEWATLAPPEWDVSLATWHIDDMHGREAVEAFLTGYGHPMPAGRLESWTGYHAAMNLLEAGESRDGRLSDLGVMVKTLAGAVHVG